MKSNQMKRITKMSETNLIMWKKGECSFIRWLRKGKSHNNNKLIMMQGITGSAKSYSAITKASEFDPEFDVKQVAFTFKEFMEIITSDWFMKKKYKVIVFDEPQISISNRNWQSLANKLMNYLLSTFRSDQIVVFFVAPYKTFLDSQSMKLVHVVMTTQGIDRKKNLAHIKFSIEQYNPDMDKFYHHSLYVLRNGVYNKLNSLYIKLPRKDLIDEYEKRKKKFNDGLKVDILNQINKIEGKVKEKSEPNAECSACNHKWHTKSNYKRIRCPSCASTKIVVVNTISAPL